MGYRYMRTSQIRQRNSRNPGVVFGMDVSRALQPTALELQLATVRLEFAELYRELFEAAQMQRSMSGPRVLRRGQFEMTAELFPVRHLSGDFFSISDCGNTTLLAIGDICGKGLLAGMWFTYMLGLARKYGEAIPSPGAALKALNRHLCTATPTPPLTSLFLARLDHDRGELLYSNAGHPTPVLVSNNGTAQLLCEGGPVLGVVRNAKFETGKVAFNPGDALVEFTDGLIECRNEQGEEFGMDRLLSESQKAVGSPATDMLFSLIGAAQDFVGTRPREDDCTLMVVKGKAPEAA
jgi:serine phosphatase RsbU (regulator of sigma subunit)